ncbi:MAG: response regulator transcription factor [Deltaproteobacteria bacterium]|jgi:DNA-binding NarL/FixJ family response regulator|nr:response regulator transcription factor [Deltaproteobacteria bacterium]
MSSYKIVLADDHVLLRDGIKRIIEESPDLRVVAEASDGLELLRVLKQHDVDMVLLDISMPGLRGIEAVREVKISFPSIKVLILTMHKKKEYIRHAFSAGADGYLLKEATGDELFDAIGTIRNGENYVSNAFSKELIIELLQLYRTGGKLEAEVLTTREREVLKLIAEGKSSKEIADLLFISIYTVNNHRAKIIKKLGMKKTADLVRYAIREGYAQNSTP